MWGTGIILIGTIAGTSLVTFGNISAMRSSRNTANAIRMATGALQQQTEKLETLNHEIAQKTEQIGNLASESLKQITGGDSFCIIHTVFSSPNNITLLLQNNGNYHVHDVIVQLQDSAESEKYWQDVHANRAAYPEDAFAALFSTTKTIQKGTVFSNSSSPIRKPTGAVPPESIRQPSGPNVAKASHRNIICCHAGNHHSPVPISALRFRLLSCIGVHQPPIDTLLPLDPSDCS